MEAGVVGGQTGQLLRSQTSELGQGVLVGWGDLGKALQLCQGRTVELVQCYVFAVAGPQELWEHE